MLEDDCVAAIADGLTDCLLDDQCDLSTGPEFQLILLSQPTDPRPTLTYFTVHETLWRTWAGEQPLPTVVTAEQCTDLLISAVAGWLPQLGRQSDAALIGCSLMYDDTSGGETVASRVLVARDIDGRTYQATLPVGGSVDQTVVVDADPPSGRVAAIAQALTTILDNRAVVVIELPTGYLLLHTVHRDGEYPYEVQSSIDPGNTLDDDAATTRAQAELANLAKHAPGNVVHTLRLIHRTREGGDRDIWAADPVRGAAPPIG